MPLEKKVSPFEKRVHEIDLVRGLLMCLVILDHLFNLLMSFNKSWAGDAHTQPFYTIYQIAHFYWTFPEMMPIRKVVRWLCLAAFCFVSGISSAFSKNNWKRAGEMIALWFLIYLFSNILESIRYRFGLQMGIASARVDFNIIGVLAWSTLIYCFVQDKSWKWLVAIGVLALAIHPVCVVISKTSFGEEAYLPFFFEPSREGLSRQADHMPLFPYLAFFLGGALLSKFTYSKERKSYFKRYEWERPFCFVGRHSLIIYATHFLLLIGIFSLVGLFIK